MEGGASSCPDFLEDPLLTPVQGPAGRVGSCTLDSGLWSQMDKAKVSWLSYLGIQGFLFCKMGKDNTPPEDSVR